MKAFVVIGANYGDEGKGLITDFLARKTRAKIVCRFNGGAQAAHTVQTDEHRHVFHSFSSGSFAGSDTYLSDQFIFNPYVFFDEACELAGKLLPLPRVYCHPNARVTTIFDIAINNILELSRGDDRHGSCGLGINETVERSLNPKYIITIEDLFSVDTLTKKLKLIREEWVPYRLAQLNLNDLGPKYHEKTDNILYNDDYELHVAQLRNCLRFLTPTSTTLRHLVDDVVIFEGAQGLGLDEELGEFPHVTRSKTGVIGANSAFEIFGVTEIQPIYVTRAYVTRHGAGPLPFGGLMKPLDHFDQTNVPNEWQGRLRFAPLHLGELHLMITTDMARAHADCSVKLLPPQLAVTCLDQQSKIGSFSRRANLKIHSSEEFVKYLEHQLGYDVALTSYGPTAQDVRYLTEML